MRRQTATTSHSKIPATSLHPVCYTRTMSKHQVDKYLASLDEPNRSTLEALRRPSLDIVPDAEQCIAYGTPAFRVHGKSPDVRRSRTTLVTCPIVDPPFPSSGIHSRNTKLHLVPFNSQSINPCPRHS